MSVALDSVMETQVAQLNLLLYQIYRPYFNGKLQILASCYSKATLDSLSCSASCSVLTAVLSFGSLKSNSVLT